MKNANAYLLAWALSSAINFAAGADNTVGFLIDGYCLKDNPPDSGPFQALDTKADLSTVPESHTLHCLRDPAVCRSSGYNIVTKEDGAAEYTLALTFDDVGNELTLAMLDTTKAGDPGPPWKEVKEQVTASDFTQTTSYIELPQGNDMHVAAIGYLVDHYCWDDNSNQTFSSPPFRALDNPDILLNVNPELHTIFCMNVEVCKDSGYVILIKEAGASNFTAKYNLDDGSNDMVKTLLGATTGVANALVQISGIVSEDKLKLSTLDWAPGAGRSGTMNTVGFLVDNWCWNDSGEGNNARFTELDTGKATLNITPWTHTLHCMRDPPQCRSSGYIIVTQQENAQNYSVALDFNDVGDALALLLLDATKQDDNSSDWRQSINEVTASDFTQSTSYIELPYTLDSIGDNSTTDNITYVGVMGYLVDHYCWDDNTNSTPPSKPFQALDVPTIFLNVNPELHSIFCLTVPAVCRESGYYIAVKEFGSSTFSAKYDLDDASNEMAFALLNSTDLDAISNNAIVQAGGKLVNGKLSLTAIDWAPSRVPPTTAVPPENGQALGSSGVLTTSFIDDYVTFTFEGTQEGWLGLGVTEEGCSGNCMLGGGQGADVVVCDDSGLKRYWVTQRLVEAGTTTSVDLPVIEGFDNTCEIGNGVTKMTFTRVVTGDIAANTRPIASGGTMIFASGDPTTIAYHGPDRGVFILQGDAIDMNTVGFLVDNWCWNDSGEGNNARFTELDTGKATLNITPWTHTLHCMRDPPQCRSSGYIIVTQQENAQNYSVALDFNDVGDALALLLLDATKQDDNSSDWRQSINEVTASDFTQSTSYIELPYTLDSIGDNSTTDNITYVGVMGYLVDHYCWDDNTNSTPPSKPFQALDVPTIFLNVNPELHSIFCLTVPAVCRESGYYIAVKEFGSSTFSAKYDLDDASNEMAFALLNSTDLDAISNNAIVQAGGKLVNGKLSLTAIDWAPSRVPPTTAVPPENGQALGSSGVLTTSFIDDYVTFTFEGTQEGWLGLGVTEEGCSGNCMLGGGQGADVVVCDDSGLKRYWVTQRLVEAGTTTSVDLPVIEGFDNTCEIGNGVTKMTFTRVVTGDIAANTRPVASGGTMIFASGDPTTIAYHETDRGVFILQGDAIVEKPNASIWAHMIFMVFSWGLLLPFGVIFARYNRTPPEWLKSRGLNWFHVHRGAQSTGWLLQLCGFISAVVYIGKTGGIHFGGPFNYHMIIGLLVVIFGTLQPLNAYFRPHAHETVDPDILCGCDDPRLRWQWIHKGSGYGAVFFGAINVVLGVHVAHQKFPGGGGLPTAAAVLAVLFLGPLVLYYLFKEATGGKVDPRPKGPHHKHMMEMVEKGYSKALNRSFGEGVCSE
jgi:hypothetical protein